jgi:acetyl esterase/lipase
MAIAGDSVGGGMTAAITLMAQGRRDVRSVHQSMYYPRSPPRRWTPAPGGRGVPPNSATATERGVEARRPAAASKPRRAEEVAKLTLATAARGHGSGTQRQLLCVESNVTWT